MRHIAVCPVGLDKDEQFQNLKKVYRDKGIDEDELFGYLKRYRHLEEKGVDWYPVTPDDYAGFTNFIEAPKKVSEPGVTIEYIDSMYNVLSNLYTPAMLNNRLNRIAYLFSKNVDMLVGNSEPGTSRQQVIKAQANKEKNGFNVILEGIFNDFEKLSTSEGVREAYAKQHSDRTEFSDGEKNWFEYAAKHYKLMLDNKKALFTLAAIRIGAREGFKVNFDGLEYDFGEKEVLDSLQEDDNSKQGLDVDEASKGDRYEDYRTYALSQTLSTEAKRLLDKIKMRDKNGKVMFDDLGYPIHVDMRQAAASLHRVLRASDSKTMMQDLEKAVHRYPWIRSLVMHLRNHPEDEAIVYCNFHKVRSSYYYGYRNNATGQINISEINNVANGKSLSKEAGVAISDGLTADEKYSIVKRDGRINYDNIETISAAIAKAEKDSFALDPKEESTVSNKWNVDDAVKEWRDRIVATPIDKFSDLADILRGLGFAVNTSDVRLALSHAEPKPAGETTTRSVAHRRTDYRFTNPIYEILTAADTIRRKAKYMYGEEEEKTGSKLFNTAQEEFKKIADILTYIEKDDTEERTIFGKRAYAAATTPNALHELIDKLSNVAGLSDKEYAKMLYNDFGQFEGMALGFGENLKYTGWLSDLLHDGFASDANSKRIRNRLKVIDFADLKDITRKSFADLTSAEHAMVSYVMYQRGYTNKEQTKGFEFRAYEYPIQADYETAYNFIIMPSHTKDELLERLAQEVECEIYRMNAINERKKNDEDPKNPQRPLVDSTYEKNGIYFQIFPEFNTNSFVSDIKAISSPTERHEEIKRHVGIQLNNLVKDTRDKLNKYNFSDTAGVDVNDASVTDWILNSFYARQQMVKLMYGGLENFKSVADFEKRNMYSHTTRLPLYTNAIWKHEDGTIEHVGKESQNVVYIGDEIASSKVYKQICKVADKLQKQGKITLKQSERMKEEYKKITTTDGQGIRTLDSMRDVKIMASTWTNEDEKAYQNIKKGEYTPEDVQQFITGIKPMYTGYEIIPAQPGDKQKPVRIPVLHKYSEMVLLPEMARALGVQSDTAPFKALNKINDARPDGDKIDLFVFSSCVKVGGHSILGMLEKDDNGNRILKSSDQMSDFMNKKLKEHDFWVHKLPYKYLGMSASIHDNVEDEQIASATQAEKETWGNILPEDKIVVGEKEMLATDGRKLFYDIKAARTVDSFKKVREMFSDRREVGRMLKQELASKTYQSQELLFALQTLDNGLLSYPLYVPSVKHDAMAVLSSLMRKIFTKVPTSGANMTQVTSLGLDADEEYQAFSKEGVAGWEGLSIQFDENDNFKYADAYVSIHNSEFERFADKDGNITPDRLQKLIREGYIDEESLYFVCYRTPSDGEHSIIPCRIKGFTCKASGPYIRLPREIMKMTGHDFDGDKMRCHFKEVTTGWNRKAIKKRYNELTSIEAVSAILNEKIDPTVTPYEVFEKNQTSDLNPDRDRYTSVRSVKYDYDKAPLDNISKNGNYSTLNNALIELMFAQLTSENGGLKMFIPGGCAETAEYADTIGTRSQAAYESPFSVAHATASHDYMMEGAGMIGVYALYNSASSMMQRLNLGYIPKVDNQKNVVPVSFFNKSIDRLFPIIIGEEDNRSLTTMGESRLLNASVDNGKEPLLGYLNQTAQLAHITNFLFAAGLEEDEIHLIFNQPVMKVFAQMMKSADEDKLPAIGHVLLDQILEKTKFNGAKMYDSNSVKRVAGMPKSQFKEQLGKSLDESNLMMQYDILRTILHINDAARDLEEFVKLTRPESDAGGIDSSVNGTVAKIIQLDKFRERLEPGSDNPVQISGVDNVIKFRSIYENSMGRRQIFKELGNELTEVVALNSMMKEAAPRMLVDYFPEARESWMRLTRRIADQYDYTRLPANVADGIADEMILWKLLSDTEFTTEDPDVERKRIVEEVPEQLRALKERIRNAEDNPGTDKIAEKLKDNIFIKNLDLGATVNAENQSISRIRFKLNGASLEDTTDLIRYCWNQMYKSKDDSISKLAIDLFKYNLYTNGNSFGRYEFSHFAPASVIINTPGYLKALDDICYEGEDWDGGADEDLFYHMYIRNHWGDKNLVPKFTPLDLPAELQTMLGFASPQAKMSLELFSKKYKGKEYLLIHTKQGKQAHDDLYQILWTSTCDKIIGIVPAQKLGIRNRQGQYILQYNPRVRDINEYKPIFTTNAVAWENGKVNVEAYVPEDSTADNSGYAGMEDEDAFMERVAAAKHTPDGTAKKLDDAVNSSEAQSNSHPMFDENGFFVGESLDNEFGDSGMFYLINRDEAGNIVPGYYTATPKVVEQARMQQAFADLNKFLREDFLSRYHINPDVILNAEDRAIAGGVTDFAAARVVGNEIIGLIQLSKDPAGEYALPEEAAHLALEMLGKRMVQKDNDGNIVGFTHENKLVERLLNELLRNQEALKDAFGGQYDQYNKVYGENREKMVVEAAGKLVAKQMFLQEYAKQKPVRNLVQRVIDAIKNFFRKLDEGIVFNAIFKSEHIASQLAKDLLSGKLYDQMKLENITSTDKFYELEKDLSNKSDLLSKMIKTLARQYDILNKRMKYSLGKNSSSASIDAIRAQLDKINSQAENEKLEVTVVDFLKNAMKFLADSQTSLDSAINNRPANSVCRKLRIVRDTVYGYAAVVKDVTDALESGEIKDEVGIGDAIKDFSSMIEKFWAKYDKVSQLYLEKFLEGVYGKDGVTVKFGKNRGKKISIHDMATHTDHDISTLSRLLDAVSDCDDYVLQAIDAVTRDAKLNARGAVNSLRPRLEAAMAALIKEQGNRDQSWMFERREVNGKICRTGRYISKEDAAKLSPARREFYNTFMELKALADACCPESMVGERKMIMLRKEHYEKMKEAKGLKNKAGEEWENAKRSVLEMGDVDFENEEVIKDFEGNIVDQLPLKFLNKSKEESYDDMTEDAASSLMAYLGMAYEYREMNNVIGMLENARYASSKRDVEQKRSLRNLITRVGNDKEFHYTEPYTVKQARSNIQICMDDFFQMHIYGHLNRDEGPFGKTRISKRKVVNKLVGYTSLSQMALNIHQRIVNVNTGVTQILVETAGREISVKDVAWASAIWVKESAQRMAETGKTDYSNKLSLWMDKFDIHQDNGRENTTRKYGRSRGSRVFNTHLMYAGLTIGEDYLAGTTALAYAKNFELIGPDGQKSNLWDAYEVKYVNDKDKTGAYLQLKEGYKKADGTELTAEDERKFQKKVIATNFALQGIYNVDDRSAIQQSSLGALAIMYRKWIAPALKRRYAGVRYSKLRDDFTEGYYRTLVRTAKDVVTDWFAPMSEKDSEATIWRILTDFNAMKNAITLNWDKMTDYEKGNCKKALREFGITMGLIIASGLLAKLPPDDHDGNEFLSWADNFAMSQLFRLRAEISSQAPTPNMLNEALRIGSSPFAALRPIADTANVVQLLWIPNYTEKMKSGRYAGKSKAHKYFMNLPLISFFKKIDNVVDPSPLLNYYKNQQY